MVLPIIGSIAIGLYVVRVWWVWRFRTDES